MLIRAIMVFFLFSMVNFVVQAEALDKVVALVNDDVITESELNAQVDVLKQQLQSKQMNLPEDKVLRKQVLQHLITVDLQLQLAKNNGINIDGVELDEAINKIAATNKLTLSRLREEVTNQGMSWKDYRENIRKEMLIARLQQKAVSKDLVVSNQQVDDYLKTMQNNKKVQQSYRIQNIVIPLPAEPTTKQVQAAKKKAMDLLQKIRQGDDFSRIAIEESSGEFALEGGDLGDRHLAELPELFAKEVVNMNVGDVVGPLRTGNGYQLIRLAAMGDEKNQTHRVTQTHVRHILLKPGASTTTAEAIKQVNNLYQQLKSGKDFALLAKQYSLDAASAIKGGDLGWVGPGELVPEFEKTMDDLPVKTVSAPVKTVFGWHLIEVLERRTIDDTDAFQRQQVREFLQRRKFSEAVETWQQHLRADAYVKIVDQALA